MNRFTLDHRWEILKTHFQCESCVAKTVRILKRTFTRNEAPIAPTVRKFVQKVRETDMLMDKTYGSCVRTLCTAENVTTANKSLQLNAPLSTIHRSQQFNISRSSLRRILH